MKPTPSREIERSHKGEWMGVKPSEKELTFEVFDVIRMKDGKATEHWGMDNSEQVLMGSGGN